MSIKNVEVAEVIEETWNQVTIIEPLADWHSFAILQRLQNTIANVLRPMRIEKSKTSCKTAEEKQQATKIDFS